MAISVLFHRESWDFTPFSLLKSLITFLEPDIEPFVSVNKIKKRSFKGVSQMLTGLIQIYNFQITFISSISLKKIIPFFSPPLVFPF